MKIFKVVTLIFVMIFSLTACKGSYNKEIENVAESYTTQKIKNPLMKGADPWIVYKDNFYYYCYSNGKSEVFVSKAENFIDFPNKLANMVWQGEPNTMYSSEYWAPELHYINDKWYIYVAADDGNNDNHRMYVLESVTDDPMGEYKLKGKVTDSTDKWAIDGTVIQTKDNQLYFVWSGWEGDINIAQNIYIAKMSNPYTLTSDRVLISKPEFDWERIGNPIVNEAPQILYKNDTIHIVYSASGSWTDDYALGLLTYTGGDLLNINSWKKNEKPVFSKVDTAYGPGHCSFVKSLDGKDDYIFYHANEFSGGGWDGRTVRLQKFEWDGDYPVFGNPVHISNEVEVLVKNK